MLNELEMALIKGVREMYDDGWDSFICIAMDKVALNLPEWPKEKVVEASNILQRKIERAINGHYTFHYFFYEETGLRVEEKRLRWDGITPKKPVVTISEELWDNYILQARMAWLDKIIETGKL